MTTLQIIIIILVVFGLTALLFRMCNNAKKELLEIMFDNDDISSDVYKKYKKDL